MSVFVVGQSGCRLMPVSKRQARLLLDGGKASVYRKVPFTIKLSYKTGSTITKMSVPVSWTVTGMIAKGGSTHAEITLIKKIAIGIAKHG